MKQLRFLHLSDVHFGRHHRCRPEDPTHPRAGYPLLFDLVQQDLASDYFKSSTWDGGDPVENPLLVAVTGDITEGAAPDEFRAAHAFLTRFDGATILGTKLTLADLFIVPGNHDVVYDADDVETRMTPFANFYSKLFAGVRPGVQPHDAHKLSQVHVDTARGFVVVEINSAQYVKKGTEDAMRGSVDPATIGRLDAVLDMIPRADRDKTIRIALLHHHPVLVPDLVEPGRGYDAVANSSHLLKLLRRYGFHVVLHGHKHYPHTFSYDSDSAWQDNRAPAMLVAAGGSASSRQLPAGLRRHNTYSIACIKWHPEAEQARIRIVTRGLVSDDGGGELLPHQWRWVTLRDVDRRLYPPRDPPGPASPTRMPHHASAEHLRSSVYQDTRGNLAVCEVLPSLIPGQAYEARLWIVPHSDHRGNPKAVWQPPERVVWSAGHLFPSQECKRADDPLLCCAINYWGPVLVQAELHFADGHVAYAYVYARMPGFGTA